MKDTLVFINKISETENKTKGTFFFTLYVKFVDIDLDIQLYYK